MSILIDQRRRTIGLAPLFYLAAVYLGLVVFGSLTLGQEPPQTPPPAAPAVAASPGADSTTSPREENMLQFLYRALKLRYTLAFLFLSFCFVALIVMNLLSVRRDNIVPPDLVTTFEQQLNDKKYQEAYETAKGDDSFLGKVLAAGMAQLRAGYDKAVRAMEDVGADENMKLDQRLGYIALIASVSPMLGLLGTVDGMVASFGVIARSDTTPKPSQLANGIEMALVTTLLGLIVAIPAIGIHTIIRNRLNRLIFEAGMESERLMGRFSEMSKKATPAA
jgi:biopolymer transport protein ExbB